jgi:rRNA maturation RNase YbeY
VKASLLLRNRQRTCRVNLRYLHKVVCSFLQQHLKSKSYEVDIHLVDRSTITWLNETYLKHQGSTDVITFDYTEGNREWLGGELFVSMPEAVAQAVQFRTSWQSELVRYIVHGILHLSGFNDRTDRERLRMKKEEDRWMRRLRGSFDFGLLALAEAKTAKKIGRQLKG